MLLSPAADGTVEGSQRLVFTWSPVASAVLYQLEVRAVGSDEPLLRAVIQPGAGAYLAPPWLLTEGDHPVLEWRVQVLDGEGRIGETTPWRTLEVGS